MDIYIASAHRPTGCPFTLVMTAQSSSGLLLCPRTGANCCDQPCVCLYVSLSACVCPKLHQMFSKFSARVSIHTCLPISLFALNSSYTCTFVTCFTINGIEWTVPVAVAIALACHGDLSTF